MTVGKKEKKLKNIRKTEQERYKREGKKERKKEREREREKERKKEKKPNTFEMVAFRLSKTLALKVCTEVKVKERLAKRLIR